jgi:hypothetical protein
MIETQTLSIEAEAPPTDEILPVPQFAEQSNLFDRDVEAALLGAILIDGMQLEECDHLDASAFHDYRHREIWQAFHGLASSNQAIEYLTVCDVLNRAGKLEAAGGDPYLTSLLNYPSSSQSARSYARIIADYAARRQMLAKATDQARRAMDLKIPLQESMAQPAVKTHWNIGELLSTDFPDPTGPVPGIIPIGLTLLGGRPKRGKSWLMLQCAYSLAIGGKFLDHDLNIIPVLYYALEDTPRRLKDRLAKFNPDPSALIEFDRELKPLHLGGIDQVDHAADNHTLIVIDTLARAMPGRDFTKDGALFADIMGRLQSIALTKNISIVIILHTRKPNGIEHDPIDDILGSTGMTASPDCVLALYREQGKPGALLQGRGRDFDDIDMTIEFDPFTCAWQLVGNTGEIRMTEKEQEILDALQDLGKAKVSTIATAIHDQRSNTDTRLKSLWTKGKVRKEVMENVNYYYLPVHDIQPIQGIQEIQDIQPV